MNAVIPLIIMAICNTWTAYGWYSQKNYSMCVVFLCYAVATTSFSVLAYKGIQ